MYLSDIDIKKAVNAGEITLSDFDVKRLQPVSYDILLGNKFFLTETHTDGFIDPHRRKFPQAREIHIKDNEQFVLHPGVSVLAWSRDYFGSSEYLIQLSGKSSLARIGLIVHNTAGIVNPGDYLNITLELFNLNSIPIILHPGMEIAQLTFSRISSKPGVEYSRPAGRYVDEQVRSKKSGPKVSKQVAKKNKKKKKQAVKRKK
ncbi:MAG TPA: dCTP deaminase [Candidatus Paceibacterota bacterium]